LSDLTRFYEDTQRVTDPEKFLSYFSNCTVLSTVSQDEDEAQWLANRSRGIGGSDIGTICGVNKYSSARLLYFKKTGQFQDSESFSFSEQAQERMHFGHKLEPLVADEFMARTGKKVVICPATLQHKEHPWALANIDRVIVDENETPVGLLEIKTADARLLKDWEDGEIPMSYIYQLNWYLWITDMKYGAFAALIGGNRFVMIEVTRNDELLAEMVPAGDKFWNYNVKNLIEPDLSGSNADTEFLGEQYGAVEKNSEVSLIDEECNALASIVVKGKAEIKRLQQEVAEATNKLKDKMQNNEIGYTADHIIKWSPRKQSRVDTDRLKSDFPEVFDKCRKTITYRAFSIKGGDIDDE
jgi:putative phage-type endonuclease